MSNQEPFSHADNPARALVSATAIAAALTAGCSLHARSPEPIPIDRAECAHCRMLISTDANGGEIVSAKDDTRFYDDVECLAADWRSHRSDATAFVRLAGGGWSDVFSASYARPAGAQTAMGSGIVAFASIAEARAADPQGRVLTFDEVVPQEGVRR